MEKLYSQISAIVFAASILCGQAEACTGIMLKANDGSIVNGRTLEFGIQVDCSVVVVPRGYEFVGTTPNGKGIPYKAKYGAVGTFAFGQPAIMDGMNEKGLTVATFYFPGYAGYAQLNAENQSKALSPVEFPNWVVTQFATVDEVKASLSNVAVVSTVTKEWGDAPPPFHYIISDKSGKSLVVEPIKGVLLTFDNPLGVLTNSPSFDWHLTNLRNFVHLNSINASPLKIGNIELAPFGQGSGMVGMPGDFTPPSRFVRAFIFATTAIPSENADKAVFQAFHILNQFDIPLGVARQKTNGGEHSDYTQITCVRDPQSLKYYFKSYDDQSVKVVDLKKFDLQAKTLKQAKSSGGETKAIDVSSTLK